MKITVLFLILATFILPPSEGAGVVSLLTALEMENRKVRPLSVRPTKVGRKRKKGGRKPTTSMLTTENRPLVYKITKVLVWFLSLPSLPFHILANRILVLHKENGPTFTVNYLKEATRLMQAYVSGKQIRHTDEFVGIRAGIPTIIPSQLRPFIKDKNSRIIRGILSLLQLYRVLESKPVLKLGTIVLPSKGISTLPSFKVDPVCHLFLRKTKFRLPNKVEESKLIPFLTAGPNSRISLTGMGRDAISMHS